MTRDIKENSILFRFICDLFFLFLLLNSLLEKCLITQGKKKRKKKKDKTRETLFTRRYPQTLGTFSVLLVTTSIGRRNALPHISVLLDVCITSPHGDRKNGQAGIHTLRCIVSVCVPCKVFLPICRKKLVSAFVQRHCRLDSLP